LEERDMAIGMFPELDFVLSIHGKFRHHAGSWNDACPHRSRAGLTVVPRYPCADCVSANDAALIVCKSECGKFEFLFFKGKEVVVCTDCWKYGLPGQDHQCRGQGSPEREGDYVDSLLKLVGIEPCSACEGFCCGADKEPCGACGGTGRAA
jgi:hypothetical protein